ILIGVALLALRGDSSATVVVSDDFQSPGLATLASRRLGTEPAGGHRKAVWITPVGSFVVARGVIAGGAESSPGAPSVAVVELGGTVREVSARFQPRADGIGLVFRYRDPHNYWFVVPDVGNATWNIYATVAGCDVEANTGLSGTRPGRLTVELDGDTMAVRV